MDDLKREHESRPRNPHLAELFFRRGLIERWGRGTLKIVEMCRLAGHPDPEFEQRAGDTIVRFLPSGYVPPLRVGHDLTERQRAILQILGDGEKWQSKNVASRFDPVLPRTTLRKDLDLLRQLGLVASDGHGAGSRWWITRTGN